MVENKIKKKKVYISFDYENDKALKDFLVGQSKLENSPFAISDWSMKEAAPEPTWKNEAENRIKRCDIVIVIAGEKTYKAPGVAAEIKMARAANIPVVQIKGLKDKVCPLVPNGGKRYNWTWDNLERITSTKKDIKKTEIKNGARSASTAVKPVLSQKSKILKTENLLPPKEKLRSNRYKTSQKPKATNPRVTSLRMTKSIYTNKSRNLISRRPFPLGKRKRGRLL